MNDLGLISRCMHYGYIIIGYDGVNLLSRIYSTVDGWMASVTYPSWMLFIVVDHPCTTQFLWMHPYYHHCMQWLHIKYKSLRGCRCMVERNVYPSCRFTNKASYLSWMYSLWLGQMGLHPWVDPITCSYIASLGYIYDWYNH